MSKPRCQMPNCPAEGVLILYNGRFICGTCFLKIDKMVKEEQKKFWEQIDGR